MSDVLTRLPVPRQPRRQEHHAGHRPCRRLGMHCAACGLLIESATKVRKGRTVVRFDD